MDMLQRLMDYESGILSWEETLDLFQDLVDSGLAWDLQGAYGWTAARLLADGLILSPRRDADDAEPQPDTLTPWGERI
jgi:hypothetical protein